MKNKIKLGTITKIMIKKDFTLCIVSLIIMQQIYVNRKLKWHTVATFEITFEN